MGVAAWFALSGSDRTKEAGESGDGATTTPVEPALDTAGAGDSVPIDPGPASPTGEVDRNDVVTDSSPPQQPIGAVDSA